MTALEYLHSNIPGTLSDWELERQFPLSSAEFKGRFGKKEFIPLSSFQMYSLELFEFHRIYPVFIPELYSNGVNYNVQVLIHSDRVTATDEGTKRHFSSGTYMYGDNNELPTLPHAMNFLIILGYTCLERKLELLEQGKPLTDWYKDCTGMEEVRRIEMEANQKRRVLSGESKPRRLSSRGPRRRTPRGDENQKG